MDVFDIAVGVAAGVIIAGTFAWCVRCIAVAESNGGQPEMRHMLMMLVILAIIGAGFYSAIEQKDPQANHVEVGHPTAAHSEQGD